MLPPSGYVTALRRRTEIPTLQLWFDADKSNSLGRACWQVVAIDGGEHTQVCQWIHPLDGNMDALAQQIAKMDYLRNGGQRQFGERIMERLKRSRDDRAKARRNRFEGIADYAKGVFRAMANGEPSVGAR